MRRGRVSLTSPVHFSRLIHSYPLSLAVFLCCQVEIRTWQALVAYRSKFLANEMGGQGKELDAAEHHLVRYVPGWSQRIETLLR